MSWTETYAGGSAEAERLQNDRLAVDIMRAQLKARKAAGAAAVDRAFHAKAVLAVEQASVTFLDTLPPDLIVGFAKSLYVLQIHREAASASQVV